MPAATPGTVLYLLHLPGARVLIGAENGLFLARAENGKVAVTTASTADTGDVLGYHDLPGAGVLVGAKNGLFLARAKTARSPSQLPPTPPHRICAGLSRPSGRSGC